MLQTESQNKRAASAYFLSLSLENVRCFKEKQRLDLSNGQGEPAQWTVIMGDNGTGKTTLLQCLARCEPKIRSVGSDWRGDSGLEADFYVPREAQASGQGSGMCFSTDLAVGTTFTNPRATEWVKDFGYRDYPLVREPTQERGLGGLICFAYGASRRQRPAGLADSRNGQDRQQSLFEPDHALSNAEEWILQLNYLARGDSEKAPLFARQRDRVREILIKVLPDVEDLDFAEDTVVLRFHTPYGVVRLTDMSLGYQTMTAWIVDLCRRLFERYPESSDPIAEPAVVLIDEMDLHLHPLWQRQLMRFLSNRFKNTQFIVTAHSPLVAQATSDLNLAGKHTNLVVLSKQNDHVVINNDPTSVHGWRVDQVLASDLFGVSTYPEEYDALKRQRREILAQSRLSTDDEQRLARIEDQLGSMPQAESPSDIRTMELIREAARELGIKGQT